MVLSFLQDCEADYLPEECFGQDHMRLQALKVFLQFFREKEVGNSSVHYLEIKTALDGSSHRGAVVNESDEEP